VPKFALNQPAITLFHKLSDDIGKSDVLKFPEYVACQKEVEALKSLVGLLGVAKSGKLTFAFDLPNMAINAKRELDTRKKWPDSPNTVRSHAAAEFRAKMDALQLWSPSQLARAQDRVLKLQSPAMFTCPVLPRPFAQTQMPDMDNLSRSIQDSLKKHSDLTSQERIDTMLTIMHFCLRLSISQRFDIVQNKAAVAQFADLSEIKRVLAAVVAAGPSDDVGAAQNVLNVIQPLLPSTPSGNGGLMGQGVYWGKYSMTKSDTQKFLRSSYWPTLGLKANDISCNDLFEALIGAVCPTALQGDSLKQTLADFRQSMGWR
jgi:Holliday junction resolvase RusA-like endonuclease